jgi:hypothetical protein
MNLQRNCCALPVARCREGIRRAVAGSGLSGRIVTAGVHLIGFNASLHQLDRLHRCPLPDRLISRMHHAPHSPIACLLSTARSLPAPRARASARHRFWSGQAGPPSEAPARADGRSRWASDIQCQDLATCFTGKIGGQPLGHDCLAQDCSDLVFQENRGKLFLLHPSTSP